MVAEKTVKNFRGLLYFAAPCSFLSLNMACGAARAKAGGWWHADIEDSNEKHF